MARLSGNRIAWTYTADDGTDYRVAADKALTDQNKLGGSAAAATVKPKPGYIKMRRCTVSDGAGHSRVVPVYEVTAPIVTAGTTINVNVGEDSASMTSNGGFIPQGPIRHPSVTKQST